MANLLADPSNWQSWQGLFSGGYIGPPSAYWDGGTSSYYLYAEQYSAAMVEMRLVLDTSAGDVVAGEFEPLTLDINGQVPALGFYSSAGELLHTVTAYLGQRSSFSFPAVSGMRIGTALSGALRYAGESRIFIQQAPAPMISYNCDCDDDYPRTTLIEMRKRVMRRLGFSVQSSNPPPGMADLIDDFIRGAQELLFRRYSVFRRERFYTWDLVAGTRFYDLDENSDACTKRLDPRMISWVGISQGDGNWRPLICGIDPVMYTSRGPGLPSHYEIRQCIELWPAPSDTTWKLRVKGQFGLSSLVAPTDQTTVEPEAIFLLAVANAKAHYGQPDAGNYAGQLTAYVRDLVRGSHMTRRYIPGTADARNAVRPVPVGGWPEEN